MSITPCQWRCDIYGRRDRRELRKNVEVSVLSMSTAASCGRWVMVSISGGLVGRAMMVALMRMLSSRMIVIQHDRAHGMPVAFSVYVSGRCRHDAELRHSNREQAHQKTTRETHPC